MATGEREEGFRGHWQRKMRRAPAKASLHALAQSPSAEDLLCLYTVLREAIAAALTGCYLLYILK